MLAIKFVLSHCLWYMSPYFEGSSMKIKLSSELPLPKKRGLTTRKLFPPFLRDNSRPLLQFPIRFRTPAKLRRTLHFFIIPILTTMQKHPWKPFLFQLVTPLTTSTRHFIHVPPPIPTENLLTGFSATKTPSRNPIALTLHSRKGVVRLTER